MIMGGWWDNAPGWQWQGLIYPAGSSVPTNITSGYLMTTTVANTNTVTFGPELTWGPLTTTFITDYNLPIPLTPEEIAEHRRRYEQYQEQAMLIELRHADELFREQQQLRAALIAQFRHLYGELE